jgi:hypothetical protein
MSASSGECHDSKELLLPCNGSLLPCLTFTAICLPMNLRTASIPAFKALLFTIEGLALISILLNVAVFSETGCVPAGSNDPYALTSPGIAWLPDTLQRLLLALPAFAFAASFAALFALSLLKLLGWRFPILRHSVALLLLLFLLLVTTALTFPETYAYPPCLTFLIAPHTFS